MLKKWEQLLPHLKKDDKFEEEYIKMYKRKREAKRSREEEKSEEKMVLVSEMHKN